MTDHRAFLATMPEDVRRRLTARTNAAGLFHLAGHAGVIALLSTLIALQVPGWPLLMIPQGIALVFLFTLQHECTHQTPFRTAWLNEVVGRVAGFLIFQPFLWFRYFHLAHHRWTNDPARDPELVGGKPGLWLNLSGWPYWRGAAATLWRNATGGAVGDFVPTSARGRVRREARAMLALYGLAIWAAVLGWPGLFLIWIVPMLLGMPFLRVYLMAEHGRCPEVADMLRNTRTVFTNGFVRFFAWNMPFHTEHHVFPAVPFHQLPALSALATAHLANVEHGYVRFTAKTFAEG